MNWFRSDNGAEIHSQDGESPVEQEVATTEVAVQRPEDPRDRTVEQLHGAYQEVVGLMNAVQEHMAAQSARSERLLSMMEGLPEALKTLPESQRNQARLLEAIQGHLSQQNRHTEGLTQAIQSLAQAADNQERSMSVIQQQLDSNQESSQQVLSSFSTLSQTLGRMGEASEAGTLVLERLASRGEQADVQMRELFGRNQRQMTVMSVVSWALAITALSVASMVAVWVGQQMADGGGAAAAGLTGSTQQVGSEGADEAAMPQPLSGLSADHAPLAPVIEGDTAARPVEGTPVTAGTNDPWLTATADAGLFNHSIIHRLTGSPAHRLTGTPTRQSLIERETTSPVMPRAAAGDAGDEVAAR